MIVKVILLQSYALIIKWQRFTLSRCKIEILLPKLFFPRIFLMDLQYYWGWQDQAICWHLWEPGTPGIREPRPGWPATIRLVKQNIIFTWASNGSDFGDRKLWTTVGHLSHHGSPHTLTSWLLTWDGQPIRGQEGPSSQSESSNPHFDTLTREQANDILIGHQNSHNKGLGEVIICYKIISTLYSLCEPWVDTTTERRGGSPQLCQL